MVVPYKNSSDQLQMGNITRKHCIRLFSYSVMITFSYVIDIIRRVYQIKFDCIATIKLHLQDITLAPARIENEIILLWYVIIYSKQHE